MSQNNLLYHQAKADYLGWGPNAAQLNPEKTKLLDQFATGKVLDLGCGSGIYTNYLSSSHQVVGVDIQEKFIQQARQKYPSLDFQVASAYELPFNDNKFDTAVLFDLLEHLDDRRALKETARVSSRLIISVPHKTQPVLHHYSLVHHHQLDKTHQRVYLPVDIEKLLSDLSLRPLLIQPALPISLSGLFISHLSQQKTWKKFTLKALLKPFLPEKPLFSSIFAVAKK